MKKVFGLLRPSPATRLGPLEFELLQSLWARGSATVRELLADGSIALAYTTVMTTLDRLYKKQLLDRVSEGRAQSDFLATVEIPVLGEVTAPGNTEAGDIVWLDRHTLLVGHGYRTNPAGIAQMRDMLKPHGVEVLTAPLPYGPGPSACLHLMSLISLLDENTALVDLPWLAVETVELLKSRGHRFIEIDSSERETLACNVLSLGEKRLVAIEANTKTNARLRQAGFEVFTFPGSEICINGSGGPTCLTRPLLRG